MTDKETAIQLINDLPDTASLDNITYYLYVHSRIDAGLRDIEAGRVVSHEEVMKSMAKWRSSSGR